MGRFMRSYTVLLLSVLAGVAPTAFGEDEPSGGAKPKDGKGKGGKDDVEIIEAVETPAVRKTWSRAEVRQICEKYNGKLVAFYGDVWKIESCARRPIIANKTVYELQRGGKQVLDVDGDTIAAIPEGEPLDLAMTVEAARSCKELNSHYITFSNVDVYYVENCKKRIFPDWETYIKHREKRDNTKAEILSLSWLEFENVKDGDAMTSVIDDQFAKLLTTGSGVDIVPQDEACAGVEGRVVAYYQKLYKIEHCHKREIRDTDLFMKKTGLTSPKLLDLTSEQWLSLPNGKPMDLQVGPTDPKAKQAAKPVGATKS